MSTIFERVPVRGQAHRRYMLEQEETGRSVDGRDNVEETVDVASLAR